MGDEDNRQMKETIKLPEEESPDNAGQYQDCVCSLAMSASFNTLE